MNNKDFTTTVIVDQTPGQVFVAINAPQAWWSGEIEGNSAKLNDEFTYCYKDIHFSKQRVIEMVTNQKVVWLVVESSLNFTKDTSEWTGTKICFEITEKKGKTELRFSHSGLLPEIECFEACSNAWTLLINEGLYSLITTGKSKEVFLA